MANKENTEKSNKQFYKTRISELEKQVKEQDQQIHGLLCRVKYLESKLNSPKGNKKPIPANKVESAREKALEIRRKQSARNKPEGE